MLPAGVRAVWDLDKAYREATPARERICINGLWAWQPAEPSASVVPTDGWGFFKVPGPWPGITDYMQKDSQTVYPNPRWQGQNLRDVQAAWYAREVAVPATWAGRRITVCAEYLNSFAVVYLDGRKAGEMRFPAGEVDLTSLCRPGGNHQLTMLVVAMPLKAVMLSFNDTASAREVRGSVPRRGLCGDVYLVGAPAGARIADVKVDTSVRNWQVTFNAALDNLRAGPSYVLRAQITDGGRGVREFTGEPFTAADLKDGRIAFTESWQPEKLWDLHTPQNTYEASVSLLDGAGNVLDVAYPERLAFREFWIQGRDFYLNGTRVWLSTVALDNAQVSTVAASYAGARETFQRLKSFGINFVYTHNYGCTPGSHLSFAEVLRAADDEGMLIGLSQPHFSAYDWQAPDAEKTNGYAQHAAFYVRVAGNHPSVVCYSTSHNSTGYAEDMNPDLIDGLYDKRDPWSQRNMQRAVRAEDIITGLDPNRIVYHHSSGNLGSMHTSNFYTNWAPTQELCDWFEHWATVGVKPVFLVEYAVPMSWDWTMYRGWYEGKRAFGSAVVPWEFCLAEWNSQFLGERAFQISEREKRNLRWEAQQVRAGRLWHRWDYPADVGSTDLVERQPIYAKYITDNWRAYRTWGVSANGPWDFSECWQLRSNADKGRRPLATDWDRLQQPGFSPDYIGDRYDRLDQAYDRSDWIPLPAGQALLRNNMPLLAYVAGKPAAFTSKDHNFYPGEAVEKQLIIINNSRQTVTCDCQWSLGLPQATAGAQTASVETGQQARIPLSFELPASLAPGRYDLSATVKFSSGEVQTDSFSIDVLPRPPAPEVAAKVALFDPKGETAKMLDGLGVRYDTVQASADLSGYDVLVIGKAALAADGPAPDIARVRDGLRVVMFEQTADALEKRIGFRTAQYGLRQLFRRVPDHPLLAGVSEEGLRDWRGEATILPPRLNYELSQQFGSPTVEWCGIPVTRVWRCGNRGNVASVLIEKPARGDFMPVLDGGFSLQYSPLMEYREGTGMVLFCQADVTGRTESDPAAETLARNVLQYASAWQPAVVARRAVYVGDPAGRSHLESAGLSLGAYVGGPLSPDQVLIVGPGGAQQLAPSAAAVAAFLRAGGNLMAIGLTEQEANAILPVRVGIRVAEHIAAYFEPFGAKSLLAGVCPADVHNRDPRNLPLVAGGATPVGGGVLGEVRGANVVFCQLVPWQITYDKMHSFKRTYRRAAFLTTRLLANMGAAGQTPLIGRVSTPVTQGEQRWLKGLYLDVPDEWDDPYRFFRW